MMTEFSLDYRQKKSYNTHFQKLLLYICPYVSTLDCNVHNPWCKHLHHNVKVLQNEPTKGIWFVVSLQWHKTIYTEIWLPRAPIETKLFRSNATVATMTRVWVSVERRKKSG